MSPTPVLFCEEHGFVNDQSGIYFENVVNLTISGSTGTCPACGKSASYVDGTYNDINGRTTATLRLSPRQLHRLKQSLAWVQQQADSVDDEKKVRVLEQTLVENIPQAKPWLEKFRGPTSMAAAAWASVLVAVISAIVALVALSGNQLSEEQFQQLLEETVRAVQNGQSPAEPGGTIPSAPPPQSQEQAPPATELPTPKTR
ncbi:hypothetical protein [Microbacterium album]|uniref:Uncharacterized protein n=1 Tax=Microbacterium album TaxID=2053191 RepID=A0A917IEG4_9MICO|nr:hypothetical protein [Microbacterium album]GGH44927.1 hypothetical protein GCM10010921_19960 [Microbacterium album]